ncbi:preprotein translocase subunit SecG [Elusimicrobium simillimum]|uniref:preprotein translocase subunit SecG n=1 Tax=Elusimicrobium simillimum TaxID=3143438 RepID=UPI003C6F99DA
MYTFILVIHFIACALLILSVLMQSGKGSAAGLFGGSAGSGDNIFAGPTAFNVLNKFTAAVAIIIFCTSISLTMISGKRGASSVIDNYKAPAAQTQSK